MLGVSEDFLHDLSMIWTAASLSTLRATCTRPRLPAAGSSTSGAWSTKQASSTCHPSEHRGPHRMDTLDALDARFLGLGLGRDRADEPAPGERRHAIGAHVEALHV